MTPERLVEIESSDYEILSSGEYGHLQDLLEYAKQSMGNVEHGTLRNKLNSEIRNSHDLHHECGRLNDRIAELEAERDKYKEKWLEQARRDDQQAEMRGDMRLYFEREKKADTVRIADLEEALKAQKYTDIYAEQSWHERKRDNAAIDAALGEEE